MQSNNLKIGDLLSWDNIPANSLVEERYGVYFLVDKEKYEIVSHDGLIWERNLKWTRNSFDGARSNTPDFILIEMNLSGNESIEDLKKLVSEYEVTRILKTV